MLFSHIRLQTVLALKNSTFSQKTNRLIIFFEIEPNDVQTEKFYVAKSNQSHFYNFAKKEKKTSM